MDKTIRNPYFEGFRSVSLKILYETPVEKNYFINYVQILSMKSELYS